MLDEKISNLTDNMRGFRVAKDMLRFKIVVAPSSKRKATQKVYDVRGYWTEKHAREDIPRLIEHLRTKRIQTFEKNIGEEYDASPPLKKRRKGSRCELPKATELRGRCLTQLLKRLQYAYYRYKTQPVSESTVLLSKKDWMKVQSSRRIDATCKMKKSDLEQEARTEASLSYLHQRLQLLQTRTRTTKKFINGLRECLYTGTCFKRIREFVSDDEKAENIIDLTIDGPAFTQENTSKAQLVRITAQCFVTYNMFLKLESRDDAEVVMTKTVLQEARLQCGSKGEQNNLSLLLAKYDADKNVFRANNSISKISEEVRLLSGGRISSKTIRMWYHEYMEKESFQEDCRGSYARATFIEQYGYTQRFQLYLKNERKLTVDAATRALEAIIMKDPPVSEDGRKLLTDLRPFTQRTVHRWMLKLGCKYEKATVSYYTDTHEAEETKRDFRERYLETVSSTYLLYDSP